LASTRIGEEDVGAEVDGLSGPFETPASARKFVQIHRIIDRDEDIRVLRILLAVRSFVRAARTRDVRFTSNRVQTSAPQRIALGERGLVPEC
jgi:hypothetical protein